MSSPTSLLRSGSDFQSCEDRGLNLCSAEILRSILGSNPSVTVVLSNGKDFQELSDRELNIAIAELVREWLGGGTGISWAPTSVGGTYSLSSDPFTYLPFTSQSDYYSKGLAAASVYGIDFTFGAGMTSLSRAQSLSNLVTLGVTSQQLTSLDISNMSSLQTINAFPNSLLTSVNISGSNKLTGLLLRQCALTQASVDAILAQLVAAGLSNGSCAIMGGTSSAPSVAGAANVTILQGRGWVVQTN